MRAVAAALGVVVAGCLEVPPRSLEGDGDGGAPDANVGGTTGYRREITIAGNMVTAPLDDFPVLVRLSGDPGLAAHASSAGLDIVFRDSGGVLLPFERELWDSEDGTLLAWVLMANLAPGNDTVFYLHYAEASSADRSDPGAVWSNDYTMVWHLDEPPDTVIDSTAGGYHAVRANGSVSPIGEGVIGGAIAFDGLADSIDFGNDLPAGVDAGEHLTVTAWARYDSLDAWSHFISKAPTGSNSHGWALGIDAEYDFTVRVMNGSVNSRGWTDAAQPETGTWYHWALIYDGTQSSDALQLRGLRNGVVYPLGFLSGIPSMFDSLGGPLYIGCATWNPNYCIDGAVDEVHVSAVTRSPEWVQAEYASQREGSSFLTIGDEEAL